MSARPSRLPALSAADVCRYARLGSDLARLTTRPAREQTATLGAGAEGGSDGGEGERLGAGVGHALNMQRGEGAAK